MAVAPAVAIAGLAISAAGTAASIASQASSGGSAGAKSAAASIDQLNYLEQQQQKKNLLTQEMIETAKNFANQQYDQEIAYLQQARDIQQQQLIQQRNIAEQNYLETGRSIEDQRFANVVSDSTTDFQKNLQLSQANLNRDLSGLQRESQYRLNETARKLSDSQSQFGYDMQKSQADLGRVQGDAQFQGAEQGRELGKLTDEQQLAMGREEALLQYMRGQDQLSTDSKLLDIQQSGVEQTAAYQKMSQDLQLYSELMGVDSQRRQGQVAASNDRRLSGQMSSSDRITNLNSSGINELLKAQTASTLNNYMMKGSLNNQLDINLAEIQTKRLGLEQTSSQLNTQLKLDEVNRGQQKAQLDAQRGLASIQDRISMLVLPEASRQLGLMQAGQQNAANKMGTQLQRAGEQNQVATGALTDEYQAGVDQIGYNIDQQNTSLARVGRDSQLTQLSSQNQAQYQQALLDLLYGNQSLDKSFELGAKTSEQARQTTMQSTNIDQLQQIALQKSALSQALSQVGAGLFSSGGGGGNALGAALDGLGGLFKQGVGVFNTIQNSRQPQNNYGYQVNPQYGGYGSSAGNSYGGGYTSGTSFTGNTAQLPSFGGR